MVSKLEYVLGRIQSRATATKSPVVTEYDIIDVFKNDTEENGLLALTYKADADKVRTSHSSCLLHLAASRGWVRVCDTLISLNNDLISCEDDNGCTPLHHAVIQHQLKVIDLLIDKFNANMLAIDRDGNTPLHHACWYGHQAVVEYIFAKGITDVTCRNIKGNTPFHLACMFLYMVKFLLTNLKIDFQIRNDLGHNAVQVACLQGRWEVVLYLIREHGCDPTGRDHYGNTLIHELIRRGDMDTLKYVVSCNAISLSCQNSFGDTPLHIACEYSRNNIVSFLIDQDEVDPSSINKQNFTPLQLACHHSCWETALSLVLRKNCKPIGIDNDGNTLLHGACIATNFEAVKHIVSTELVKPMCKNKIGDTPLHIACCQGSLDIVKYFFSLDGYDAECRNNTDDTPLHYASQAGHADIVEYLLVTKKVNSSCANSIGNTPLHVACGSGHTNVAKVFASTDQIKKMLEMKNTQGKTPPELALQFQKWNTAIYMATLSEEFVSKIEHHLHLFCFEGYFELVLQAVLTLPSLNVDCRDRFNNTPLHHACKSGKIDVINCLLTDGKADPTCTNDLQNAPIHTAALEGHIEALKCLMSTRNVDPNVANKNEDTVLHMACSRGHYLVVKFLLKSGRLDPFKTNKDGKKPVDLVKPEFKKANEIIQLFTTLKENQKQCPTQSFAKVFICGDSMSGKSSLAKVVYDRLSRRRFSKGMRKHITGVKLQTLGIVPYDIKNPDVVNITLYDLSGHPNYHSSHVAFVKSLNQSSPGVFVLVVDTTLPDIEIRKQLLYWHSIIISTCSPASKKSKIIVVASHVDRLDKKLVAVKKQLVEDTMAEVDNGSMSNFVGCVGLNCSKIQSKRLPPFFEILSESCKALESNNDSNVYCHLLYNFLVKSLNENVITLVNLLYRISSDESCLLPSQSNELERLLVILQDKGLIILTKPNHFCASKWIIIDRENILTNVVGRLFFPTELDPSKSITSLMTGIVSDKTLQDTFPDLPIHTLVGLLQGLQLCYEVNSKILAEVPNNLTPADTLTRLPRMFFFPQLVMLEEPSIDPCSPSLGWVVFPLIDHHFRTPYLMHIMMLRLLRTYCLLDVDDSASNDNAVCCFDVWKTGFKWVTHYGIEVTVKCNPEKACIVAVVSYNDEARLEHLKLRSSLLKLILTIIKEIFPTIDIKERIVPGSQVHNLLRGNLKDLTLYSIEDIGRAGLMNEKTVVSIDKVPVDISSLVYDDPFLHLTIAHCQHLFDEALSSQPVPDSFLEEVKSQCNLPIDSNDLENPFSYRLLRDHLYKYSILGRPGVTPLVSIYLI